MTTFFFVGNNNNHSAWRVMSSCHKCSKQFRCSRADMKDTLNITQEVHIM
uniref:Uncharacterized protein n=1 Tax=Arundo donax TaxID=35708 RepID=A0A0A8Z4N8_ARUDO